MNDYITTQHLIDKFWESVPHVWRHTVPGPAPYTPRQYIC